MKYYIIAGEASGDLHGSNLIKALHKTDTAAIIRCWGGDKMQAAGATLVKHFRDLAFMGFAEVLLNIRTIIRNLKFCKEDIRAFKPDVLVLIDYPGFNLRIAAWARQAGIKVVYYISPQVWAWKENRVQQMKKCINKMLVILPFEKAYYKTKWNWEVEYVGHPLTEAIAAAKQEIPIELPTLGAQRPVIALLPGSRKQEIRKKLPVMLEVSKAFPDYNFVVARAPGLADDFYRELLNGYANVSAVSGKTYGLLQQATAALVTSGTATLETALLGVPQVVCYKGNPISYQIAKRLINIRYISLVNLIMDRQVVEELIQDELNVTRLTAALRRILPSQPERLRILEQYGQLQQMLETDSRPSEKAAISIVATANC